MTETLHIFEKAGLGKAPFKCLGVFENWYVTGGGSHRQPGGTCAYCGTGILYCYAIKSADGKRFVVGCECVRRTGDDGLIKGALNSPKQRKINRAKRKAKDDAVIAEWKALTESAEFVAYFGNQPAKTGPWSRLESFQWVWKRCGAAGRARQLKAIKEEWRVKCT